MAGGGVYSTWIVLILASYICMSDAGSHDMWGYDERGRVEGEKHLIEDARRWMLDTMAKRMEEESGDPLPENVPELPKEWRMAIIFGNGMGRVALAAKLGKELGAEVVLYPENEFGDKKDLIDDVIRRLNSGQREVLVTNDEIVTVTLIRAVANGKIKPSDLLAVGVTFKQNPTTGQVENVTEHIPFTEQGEPEVAWPGGFYTERMLLDYATGDFHDGRNIVGGIRASEGRAKLGKRV